MRVRDRTRQHKVRQALVHLCSKLVLASTIDNTVACGVETGRCEEAGCHQPFQYEGFSLNLKQLTDYFWSTPKVQLGESLAGND